MAFDLDQRVRVQAYAGSNSTVASTAHRPELVGEGADTKAGGDVSNVSERLVARSFSAGCGARHQPPPPERPWLLPAFSEFARCGVVQRLDCGSDQFTRPKKSQGWFNSCQMALGVDSYHPW
jgi:hypothetical protein